MPPIRFLLAISLLPSALAAAPAIPDRPIARTEVVKAVRAQFAAMDTNRDGAVSPAEFAAYRARTQGVSDDNPFGHVGGHWFEHADANGDGRVTLAEAEARPLQLFDTADLDHDGVISASERKMAMMMLALGK